ncbi:MAG: RibD family protein [Chthoniobacterales bacterium]
MKNRPYILANFAITLDGKISTRKRTPSTFTSKTDKQELLRIRSHGDAVMVGRSTLEADTMSLGLPNEQLRNERKKRSQAPFPLRIVVSRTGKLSPKLKIFNSPGGKILLFVEKNKRKTKFPNTEIHPLTPFDLNQALSTLYTDYAVRTLVCEGGPTLFRSLVEKDIIDELRLTLAPCIFGGEKAPGLLGLVNNFLPRVTQFKIQSIDVRENEAFLTLRRQRQHQKKK